MQLSRIKSNCSIIDGSPVQRFLKSVTESLKTVCTQRPDEQNNVVSELLMLAQKNVDPGFRYKITTRIIEILTEEDRRYVPISDSAKEALVTMAKQKNTTEFYSNIAYVIHFIDLSGWVDDIAKALVIMARQSDSDAYMNIASAIGTIAKDDKVRKALVKAGVAPVLVFMAVTLTDERDKANLQKILSNIAAAIGTIAKDDDGRKALVNVGVAKALAKMADQEGVKTCPNVLKAIQIIAENDGGRKALVEAGVDLEQFTNDENGGASLTPSRDLLYYSGSLSGLKVKVKEKTD